MFLRKHYRRVNGERKAYWALVESYRTARGSRQRVVAYLGDLDEAGRLGVKEAAEGRGPGRQRKLFDDVQPEWVEVDVNRIRVERTREYGGSWLGLELMKQVGLLEFLKDVIPSGREEISWDLMATVLVLCRLCDPSSELHIAEHLYEQTALEDLLGIPAEKVNDDRLYRALDAALPHKAELERRLKDQLGTLFDLRYDLLMYDITSTYFEGEAKANSQAKRGYSRDKRSDCKQVCIGLVVSRCGMPLGYEVFEGNRSDKTTVQEMVETMESRYGKADRIWVMDRGMASEDNLTFLQEGGRRYILGTPKSDLKPFERELVNGSWETIREGLEVQLCPSPEGEETYILCRSQDRGEKDRGILERFEKRIEAGLEKIKTGCEKRNCKVNGIERRIGRLLGQNSRAAGLFDVTVDQTAKCGARITWTKREDRRQWAQLTHGCYLLRTNVIDWSPQDLWHAYMQLHEAETAFRIHKSDLSIRPIWHQKPHRVQAHILVCFLAYVLWKTLAQLCKRGGLGDEPRRVLNTLKELRVVDVILPTKKGNKIRKRCIQQPTDHQKILLDHLGLRLPKTVEITKM